MKETINKRVCDCCKKEQEANDGPYFGGHPFNGWIEVSQSRPFAVPTGNWDFCTPLCVITFFSQKKHLEDS